jgi:hypothetical protein
VRYCCDEFREAVESTFAQPIDEPTGWVLYGTDHTSVAAGQPELRYWPIRHCPFCGAKLTLPDQLIRPRSRPSA